MNEFNSTDYYTRKKKKNKPKLKYSSKFEIAFQIFFATFIIVFIIIVISILKFTSKMDIDSGLNDYENSADNYTDNYTDDQRTIDKRLILIQQEENAPNDAKKLVAKENFDNSEVIDSKLFEQDRKQKKLERLEKQKQEQEENKVKNIEDEEENSIPLPSLIKQNNSKNPKLQAKEKYADKNIIIMSKVLVGKYTTLEEALNKQSEIKESNPGSMPYVKKVGDIYTVQMGSHQDFASAKSMAASLKSRGYDVWIYQQ